MVEHIELSEDELPDKGGFHIATPTTLTTSVYLSRVKDRIEKGLNDIDKYTDFIQHFQMDLLLFFVVASEDIKKHHERRLVEAVMKEQVCSDASYNEMAIIDTLSEKKFWEMCSHYDVTIRDDGYHEMSAKDITDLRNTLVHEPGKFAEEPPSPERLIIYINSTLNIIELLND